MVIAALQAAYTSDSNPGRCPGLLQYKPFGLYIFSQVASDLRSEIATAQGSALGLNQVNVQPVGLQEIRTSRENYN